MPRATTWRASWVATIPAPASRSALPSPLATSRASIWRVARNPSRTPQARRARLDGIEQRPVAVLEHIAFRKRGAQLQPKRAQHAIVAVVTLQDHADERGSRSSAGGA